jgi:uncharacterized membrane protein YgcG
VSDKQLLMLLDAQPLYRAHTASVRLPARVRLLRCGLGARCIVTEVVSLCCGLLWRRYGRDRRGGGGGRGRSGGFSQGSGGFGGGGYERTGSFEREGDFVQDRY